MLWYARTPHRGKITELYCTALARYIRLIEELQQNVYEYLLLRAMLQSCMTDIYLDI